MDHGQEMARASQSMLPPTMPLTFPSHAAAVWPLHRAAPRVLPAAALIVGSCTPDLAYLLSVDGLDGLFTHSPRGTVLFSIPVGSAALAWLDLVAPALKVALPDPAAVCLRRPVFPRTFGALWRAVLALWLGALTHLLWDGFTHRTRWPASVLYPAVQLPLPFSDGTIHLANLLQHLSTVLGLALAWLWLRQVRVAAPVAPARQSFRGFLVGATFVGSALAVAWGPPGVWNPWLLFWTTAKGALVGGTLACLLLRLATLPPSIRSARQQPERGP